MVMKLVLPCLCLLGVVVEVWGESLTEPPNQYEPPNQSVPPNQYVPPHQYTPPHQYVPPHQYNPRPPHQYHQPGFAPAGYGSPAIGHGMSMSDPRTLMLLDLMKGQMDGVKLIF